MWRNATVTAYDCLQDVVISATVHTADGASVSAPARVMTASVQVRGTGEESDARWLRDALVALAESL